MRMPARVLLILAGLGVLLLLWMYNQAVATPVVRRANIAMSDWPSGEAPIRVAFLSDVHVAGPDMPPERLSRIVTQVNALEPDLVLFGGDFVSDKRVATRRYPASLGLTPLRNLRARLGVYAVMGNHDHWRSAPEVRSALQNANVLLIDNDAVTVGPLRLGGVDDAFTGRADVLGTVAAMRRAPGSRLLLSHSPDVVPATPKDVTLILAGHTHCGQIRLPLLGAVSYMSKYGERFACGLAVEDLQRTITSAGLGTSVLPFRLGAPPDLWLLSLGPATERASNHLATSVR